MSRFLNRFGLALLLVFASNAWAIGLGDIRLRSALNQPLDAEITLLSATPEELTELSVILASAETFERYDLDRPAYLNDLRFVISRSGGTPVVRVTSTQPMTEPFLTFLVEATWGRGRLLREYTVLLDPPTFAPPQPSREAVQAPQQSQPRDAGRIERQPAPAAPAPRSAPREPARSAPSEPSAPPAPYSTRSGADYVVAESQTLWRIASEVRPDSRLTINQTMLAIYEANPQAFGGNINVLKAGASLRIPSADEIFRIDRRSALDEVQRQHDNWDGKSSFAPAAAGGVGVEEAPEESSLTLVPPDDSVGIGVSADDEPVAEAPPVSREDEILDRIDEIEAQPMPEQPSLIDIRNNELANLRRELAEIRGEVYEPPVEDSTEEVIDPFVSTETDAAAEPVVDDAMAEADDDATAEPVADTPPQPQPAPFIQSEPSESLVDKVLGVLGDFWMVIVGVVVAIAGLVFWFLRRGRSDGGEEEWNPLDRDDHASEMMTGTETQSIPPPEPGAEDTIVVEERMASTGAFEDTMEVPAATGDTVETPAMPDTSASEPSIEDTFSSETAVNIDQSDPIAEADFHMAYGLYDQAADLVNGALQTDPDNSELLTKLCEIYFVWGNRDAFVDAAQRVKSVDGGGAEWDKIVIMGQQIAGDHALFSGAGVGATKEVDLSFGDDDSTSGGDLDMVFGDDDTDAGDSSGDGALDFVFDDAGDDEETLEITRESPTVDMAADEGTAEMPTMERPLDDEGTTSMPAMETTAGGADGEATAEIDLDDLGLDLDALDGFSEDDIGGDEDDDSMEITGSHDALGDTGVNESIDPDATGMMPSAEATGVDFDLSETGMHDAVNTTYGGDEELKVDFDMLEATGKTQVLPESQKVETINQPLDADLGAELESLLESGGAEDTLSGDDETLLAPADEDEQIGDDAETLLASLDDDDDGDFDFAKTEALPSGDFDADKTVERPTVASTDMDLDLDDLTAALDLEGGDTVQMPQDDATVEQPRPPVGDEPTAEMPSLGFDDDDELGEARTMTEVGTKLDLARAYIDMGDPSGARSILEEVLDEGDDEQRQQAQKLLDSLPG